MPYSIIDWLVHVLVFLEIHVLIWWYRLYVICLEYAELHCQNFRLEETCNTLGSGLVSDGDMYGGHVTCFANNSCTCYFLPWWSLHSWEFVKRPCLISSHCIKVSNCDAFALNTCEVEKYSSLNFMTLVTICEYKRCLVLFGCFDMFACLFPLYAFS